MSKNQLRVAIVGGGIGGVAAATVLLRRGMEVRLYEQAPAFAEVGAGVAIQPNGARMLERLGLDHELARFGVRGVDSQFRRQHVSYAASMSPPDLASRIEFYGLHRAELLATFVGRLPREVVCTGHRCVAIEQDEEQATLNVANGASAVADVVIGADGIQSSLRQYVTTASQP